MFKLKRLEVTRYRNVKPGTELNFNDHTNLILGQNAAGKTTLLALLSVVCRSAFEGIADEEFAFEYVLQNSRFTVTADVAHHRVNGAAAFGAKPQWADTYEILIEDNESPRRTKIVSSRDVEEPANDDKTIDVIYSRVDLVMSWSFIAAALSNKGGDLGSSLRQSLLQDFAFTFRFDESLDCFSAITGRLAVLATAAGPPVARHALLQQVNERGISSTTSGDFIPMAIGHAIGHAFERSKSAHDLSILGGAEQGLNKRIADALNVREVSMSPNVRSYQKTPNLSGYQIEGFTFEITRSDGTTIHHDRLSYGQKRLLAFLYYLEGGSSVVIADELVNGLHHRWIDVCMGALEGRQSFLTSQNPLIFDYVTFDSPEQVQSSFVTCKTVDIKGHEQLAWQNMSAEDAQTFFGAYEVGIEHVGDILITRGLW